MLLVLVLAYAIHGNVQTENNHGPEKWCPVNIEKYVCAGSIFGHLKVKVLG